MENKTYTEEQVRNIIDLTWGYAYEDWQVPSTEMQDAVLKMNELGLTNSDMKQLNFVCPKCSYPTFKMHHEDFLRCHGCEWTGTHVPDSHSLNTEQTAIIYQEYKNGDFIDTLQEGDWCKFDNESQARENSKHWIIASDFLEHAIKDSMQRGVQFVNGTIYLCHDKDCKTKLAPEEFLRRAENTFKTK